MPTMVHGGLYFVYEPLYFFQLLGINVYLPKYYALS